MPQTVVSLWFDGQAEQAADYYVSIFPNSRVGSVIRALVDTPSGPGDDSVLTVDFSLDGREFVGINGGPQFPFTEAVSIQVRCADQAEIDYYWERLCDGGEEGVCGWLKDRFGLSWQVIPSAWIALATGDRERARRGMQAVLGMTKIDVAEVLRAAGDGGH